MYTFRTAFLTSLLSLAALAGFGQHYYTDQWLNADIMKRQALYRSLHVTSVQYSSFDNNNQPIEGFEGSQTINSSYTEVHTLMQTTLAGSSDNSLYFNPQGQLVKSVDTTDGNKTVVTYTYDAANHITGVVSESFSPGNYTSKEQHLWQFSANGKPEKMWKIKNDNDTTYITFVSDENGNIGEERSIHHGQSEPTIYYYYDDQHRLTDVVRYNVRAKRLLPDYMFEYNAEGRLQSMLVTTEGATDYQKWYYQYNEQGLKTEDKCFSKSKELIGRVEYQYQH